MVMRGYANSVSYEVLEEKFKNNEKSEMTVGFERACIVTG